MTYFRQIALYSLGLLLAAGVIVGLGRSVAAQFCSNDTDCETGDVCVFPSRGCGSLDLNLSAGTIGSQSFSQGVESNTGVQAFTLHDCLGSGSACGTPAAKPSLWRNHGALNGHSVSFSSLRPGRRYAIQYYAEENGATATDQATFTTWPGFQAPSDLNLQVTGVTDNGATISWNTVFPGDTFIWYGRQPPATAVEFTSSDTNESFTDLVAFPNGEAWATTTKQQIMKRAASGSWSTVPLPLDDMVAISALDAQHVWLGGPGGDVAYTLNGTTWQTSNIGVLEDLTDFEVTGPTTVWAITSAGRILFADAGATPLTWQTKTQVGVNLYGIVSVDGKEIYAVGDGGRVVISRDGGATWSTVIVDGGTSSLRSIATLDGQNLIVGGSNGRLYRSTNSGSSWPITIPTGGISAVKEITPVSDDAFWFTENNRLGWYDPAVSPNPVFDTNANIPLVGRIDGLDLINGANILALSNLRVIGRYAIPTSVNNWSQAALTTSHSHTFSAELVAGAKYDFSVISTGSGISAGAFGTFTTTSPDTEPPTIAFTNPATSPFYTNTPAFTASGTANDNLNLQTVTLTQNGTARPVTTNPTLPSTSTTWSSALTLQAGTNTLVATATDFSTSTADGTATATVVLDTGVPTVTITAPANGSTVNTATIPANGTATDNDQVATMRYILNGGAPQNLPITAGGSVNWSVASIGPLNLGSNTLTVYARDRAGNEGSATSTFTYSEPTFTLSAVPTPQTKNAGDTVVYNVTATSVNGFAGAINLTAAGTPGGSTTVFSPQPLNLSAGSTATSAMTITTNITTTGTFTITITGNGNGKTATTTVQLTLVPPPDFTLSAIPVVQNIVAGQGTSYQINASANSTFSGTINFSLSGQPAGAAGSFSPATLTLTPNGNQTTTLGITTTSTTPDGSHTLTITGTSGSITRTVVVTLNISAPPDISLVVSPLSQIVTAGNNTFYNGTVTALNGFNESITITTSPAINGVTMTPSPATMMPTPGGVPFVLNVVTTSAATSGTHTVTIRAANGSGSVSKTVDVTLQINPDTVPPVITDIVATPNWNSVRITWKTNELADSSVSIYADAARTSLVGVVTDAADCLDTCHDLVYFPLTPMTTYYFSVTSCDQAVPANCSTRVLADDGVTALQFTTLDEPDTIPPTVTIDQPAPNTDVLGAVTIAGTATDNKNMSQVQLLVYPVGNPGSPVVDQGITCTGLLCNWSYVWNTLAPNSPNGAYTIQAIAVDLAGNASAPVQIVVNVVNDRTDPQLTCDVEVDADPISGQTSCGGGQCWQAIITWCTDDMSTTQVDYGTSVSCSGSSCTYPQGPVYGDPADPNALTTNHAVTLTNLDANQLYHYRISSCNISGLCTH